MQSWAIFSEAFLGVSDGCAKVLPIASNLYWLAPSAAFMDKQKSNWAPHAQISGDRHRNARLCRRGSAKTRDLPRLWSNPDRKRQQFLKRDRRPPSPTDNRNRCSTLFEAPVSFARCYESQIAPEVGGDLHATRLLRPIPVTIRTNGPTTATVPQDRGPRQKPVHLHDPALRPKATNARRLARRLDTAKTPF